MNVSIMRFALVGIALCALASNADAQADGWKFVERWQDHWITDVECRGHACISVGAVQGMRASAVRGSTDDGRTWRDLLRYTRGRDSVMPAFFAVQFLTDTDIIVGCDSGRIAVSSDAGESWTIRRIVPDGIIRRLHMATALAGAAMVLLDSGHAVIVTDDGGNTWRAIELPDSVSFADSTRLFKGIEIGVSDVARLGSSVLVHIGTSSKYGTLLRTSDLGASWTEFHGDADHLLFLEFADSLNGWWYGGRWHPNDPLESFVALRRTTDGGQSWLTTLTGAQLTDADVHSGRELLVCGVEGRAFRSSDGGLTWAADSFRNFGFLKTFCAHSAEVPGVIISGNGELYLPESVAAASTDLVPLQSVRIDGDRSNLRVSFTTVGHRGRLRLSVHTLAGELIASTEMEEVEGRRFQAVAQIQWPVTGAVVLSVTDDARLLWSRLAVFE
jgi:hypothetical protein